MCSRCHGEIPIAVRMIFGNCQAQWKKPDNARPAYFHKPSGLRGEYQGRRMAEVHEAEMPVGMNLAVNHGGVLPPILVRIAAQSVSRSDRLSQPQIDSFEHVRRCLSVTIKLRKHERMEGIVYGGGNLRRDDVVPLSIHQEHTCRPVKSLQVFGDPELF